ncbi:MAG: hypothetical protein HOK21_13460 [Rhodospirillaceae bacterium]|jgi:hypothetical protein|nr:hypothetical protein [Rhodospirillaceae bacterium]MBT4045380.1 hypothetical protein [Rhodospirillaceae bacterium]MBT4688405.1 hypothetical protein [Rhodospirillaceae bacterium]MBT5084042.1 hypothetical protein [Rhodospirillaceae bacterium]MBT5525091.1 hypothetical protein [Rhodospirillaceae bacterium]
MDTNRVAEILAQKGAHKPCHRCDHVNFTVLDGFTKLLLQQSFRQGVEMDGPSVPVVSVACSNCGAVTAHALGALGLNLDT